MIPQEDEQPLVELDDGEMSNCRITFKDGHCKEFWVGTLRNCWINFPAPVWSRHQMSWQQAIKGE